MNRFLAALLLLIVSLTSAVSQVGTPGLPIAPLGYCQLSAAQLAASIGLSSCTRAAFTATGSGTALTTTSVTGIILVGDGVSGTGIVAGTTVLAQVSGTAGGAGVYTLSAPSTSSGASLVSGGIPPGATMAYLYAETAGIRYRDDGGAPTASIGMIIASGSGIFYSGRMSALRFILQTGSPLLNVAFYREP